MEDQAELFAYLPQDDDAAAIKDFSSGGIFPRATDYLPDYLADLLSREPTAKLVFDDVMASAADLGSSRGAHIVRDGQVFHCIDQAGASRSRLKELVWMTAAPWHFVCLVLLPDKEVACLDPLADPTEALIRDYREEVIVGAFDGEGFVRCSFRS